MRREALLLGLVLGTAGCTEPFTAPPSDPLGPAGGGFVPAGVANQMKARSQKPPEEPPAPSEPAPPPGETAARTVALVNERPILESEVREAVFMHLPELLSRPEHERPAMMKELFQEEMRKLIEREMILEDMANRLKKAKPKAMENIRAEATQQYEKRIRMIKRDRKMESDEDLAKLLATQGLTLSGLKRQIERNHLMMAYVQSRVMPAVDRITPQDVREYYDEHPEEFRVEDKVKWMDLFIDASRFPSFEEARRYSEQLAAAARGNNVDFGELVKTYDCGDSKFRGGFGLGEKPGEIVPPVVEPAVLRLKEGEVGPPVELGSGFHIVKVVERVYPGRMPLDEKTQQEVRRKIQGRIAETEYKLLIEELKAKTSVRVLRTEP